MELLAELELSARKIKLGLDHTREIDVAEGEWVESEYNYRLNMCDEIFYMVEGDIVLGHVGLSENQIKTIYVVQEHRGKKVALKMYKALMNIYPVLLSDDAREPAAQKIWEKLLEENPSQIKYDSKKDYFIFRQDSFK